ncbi:dihydrofolate reductase family protein, partial [Tabrizicola sp.]|uniref:dihydrofolate reductase family protein n=1 Tax=Tabrizicola sp. TaxID=2005166 RepID=UPI003F37C8B1
MLGGGRLQMAFLESGALDELELFIIPEMLGGGRPLFPLTGFRSNPKLVSAGDVGRGCVRLHSRFEHEVPAERPMRGHDDTG